VEILLKSVILVFRKVFESKYKLISKIYMPLLLNINIKYFCIYYIFISLNKSDKSDKSRFLLILYIYIKSFFLFCREKITCCAGSYYYMAPEMLSVQSHDFKCDIWSMGVILYEMITKRFPFPATVNYVNQSRNTINMRVF